MQFKYATLFIFLFVYQFVFSQSFMDSTLKLIANEQNIDIQLEHYEDFAYRNYFTGGDKYEAFKKFDSAFLQTVDLSKSNEYELTSQLFHCKILRSSRMFNQTKRALSKLLVKSSNEPFYYYSTIEEFADLYADLNDYDSTVYYATLLINADRAKITEEQLAHAYYLLSTVNGDKGYLNIAANYLLKADSIIEGGFNKGAIYSGLTSLYYKLENYEKAKFYNQKALDIVKELKREDQYHFYSYYSATIETELKNYTYSDSVAQEAKKYFNKEGDIYMEYYVDILLGTNQLKQKKYNQANKTLLTCLQKAEQIFKDTGNMIELNLFLAKGHLATNNINQSKQYISAAKKLLLINKNIKKNMSVLDVELLYFIKSNQVKKAIAVLHKKDSLESEFNKKANLTHIEELNIIHETELKDKKNELLKVEKAQVEEAKQNQLLWLLIGIITLIFALVLVYVLYKNRQKKNKKLQELDVLKSKFFESISHELRTPLTLIELPIKKAINEQNNTIPYQDLKTIKYNTTRLQNLMNDLLIITKIEANKYPVNNTKQNIVEQITVLAAQFDSLAESKNITYIKKMPKHNFLAVYDKEILNKVIINLLSNALKYTEQNGEVTVKATIQNNMLNLLVADTGIGISHENQKYIFDRFYRAQHNNEAVPGAGIGLAIVKELVELTNGNISFTSNEHNGTVFNVNIPISEISKENINTIIDNQHQELIPVNNTTYKAKQFPLENIEKPHVLIVEDNQDLLAYIEKELKQYYKVFTANNGSAGVEKAIEIVPDIILTDWLMPNKNGIELCQELKTNTITNHIPIIMLTAKTEVEDQIKGIETGADSYFAKPFEMEVVKAQIKNLISQRKNLIEKFQKSEHHTDRNIPKKDIEFWNNLTGFVETELSNPEFNVQLLADKMLVSRMQLNRKLKAIAGITGSDYIIQKRMSLAVDLLAKNEYQIAEIAYQVGYDNPNSFSRAFKKYYNQTPTEYIRE